MIDRQTDRQPIDRPKDGHEGSVSLPTIFFDAVLAAFYYFCQLLQPLLMTISTVSNHIAFAWINIVM